MAFQIPTVKTLEDATARPILGIGDAALLLGLSEWKVRNLIREGRIQATRVNRRWEIPTDKFLADYFQESA